MLQALIGPATKLLGKFIEDKDVKNKLAHEIATMAEKHAQELAKGQLEITFDMESLLTVLMGILGLGGLRTFEKFKGITK